MPSGQWDDEERSRRGCCRWDLAPVPWDVDVRRVIAPGAYTGRHQVPGLREFHGKRCNPDHPPEDPDDGCPGGWRIARFVLSLDPYLRIRAEGGQRVNNRTFDESDNPLVWAWVHYYEREQERCERHQAWIALEALKRG